MINSCAGRLRFCILSVLALLLLACSGKKQFVINDISEVEGIKLGVVMGTTHVDYVKEDFPNGETFVFEGVADLLYALEIGKTDAVAIDAFIWKSIAKENPGIVISLDNWRAEPFGMIFNKENEELLAQYNTFLSELKESGELQQIVDKWLNDEENAQMPDLSQVKRSGAPLKVGCTGTMSMFDFIKDGKNCGLDIEIIERFAAYLKRPVEFNIMNFAGLIASVTSNVSEIASSSICITEERAKQVNFGDSYCSGHSVILIRKENAPAVGENYTSLDDLKESSIATLLGSMQDLWVKENYKGVKQLVFNNRSDIINALESKQCNAIILDSAGANEVLESSPKLAILQGGFCPVEFSVCFGKGSPLLEQFNDFQRKLKESGELDQMFEKWTDTTRKAEHLPVVFEEFGGVPIRFGTTLLDMPYSYVVDGKPAGFDVELVSKFAKSIKRSVELTAYDFGGLIPSLSAGRIDIVANSVMYTLERAEMVAFAEPYRKLTSCALVLAEDLAPEHPNSKHIIVEEKSFWESTSSRFYDNLIKEKRWQLIVDGLGNTILISILSILFGTFLGVGVCAMRMSHSKLISTFAKGYIGLIRGIPVLVLLMILFYVVFAQMGVGAITVAIITFALNFAAYVSEMFRSGLESIDPGQRRAGIAMGFTGFQTFRYIILPQTVKRVLPVFKGEAISLVKTTSIVGYIAVADLTKASDIIRSRTFDAFFPLIIITIIYFVLAWLLGKGLDLIGKPSKNR